MIALQMIGEGMNFVDFAADLRECQRMVESAKQFLRKKGYQIVREGKDAWSAFAPNGSEVRILTGATTPNGVRR
jgi:hypothetical protein